MEMNEQLLRSWLQLSLTICNRKFLSSMSVSEAVVCNLILEKDESGAFIPYTATELCRKMGMLKSQMNKTLNSLEERGLIARARSETDKRYVRIVPRSEHLAAYSAEHARVLSVVDQVMDMLGADECTQLLVSINGLTQCVNKIIGKD